MSNLAQKKTPPAGNEPISITLFQEELRRGVQAQESLAFPNALADVVKSIEMNPAFPQSRLLARLLAALITQVGEFRSAEVFAFDTKMRAMVVALLDAFAAGIPGRDEWQRAVDSATAAQRAYG